MLDQPDEVHFSTAGVLDCLVQVLQSYPRVKKAFYGNDSDGDWAAMESLLAMHQDTRGWVMRN
ncbi:hypothetical protein PHMEG_00025024 [Phytophthora megakarya]|uniref:Uncharacterized protein n=1 Tax=Phytophthora megakarya TaxID=4795 RepID=A0A225VFK5_9STRA|nr:hypothetical protein PHMEG_00025024 [Phytophthora megakarya]